MNRFGIWLVTVFLVLFCAAPILAAKTIKIGGLFDITGDTGLVGTPYAEGVRDYVRYLNEEQGGINGTKIELLDVDYVYKISQAIAAYKKFKHEKVVAILGWGTGDTEAMSPLITKDKIPYFSASYSEQLTDPKVTPYNFMVGTTYVDQARIALKFIKDTWTDKSRKPRVAFIYNDTGFGRSPFFTVKFQGHVFPGAKDYAKEIGVDVVAKTIISLSALDTTLQLRKMKKADPDFAICQETSVMATILKDAQKLNLRTKFFALNWAMSGEIAARAGEAAEGCYWTNPFCTWEDNDSGVKQAKMISQKYHPRKVQSVNYFQGFTTMKVLAEAISRVKGEINGPAIKAALEEMTDFDIGGLTVPISFSAKSHKGSMGLRIYQIQKGHFVPVKRVLLSR